MNVIARQFEVSSAEAHHYKVVIINVSHIICSYMDCVPSYMPKLKNNVCVDVPATYVLAHMCLFVPYQVSF